MLSAARDERMAKDPPDSMAVLSIRERWARFLLTQGEADAADTELRAVVQLGKGRALTPLALAHADLSRLAVERGNAQVAIAESRTAIEILERVAGLYDVRIRPHLWRTQAAALAASGDTKGAAQWNERALEASRIYDDPSSASSVASADDSVVTK